jgi:hypothetical protein
MPQCPSCDSRRIVIRIDPLRQAFCAQCGTQWTQEGSAQLNIGRPPPLNSVGQQPPVPTDAEDRPDRPSSRRGHGQPMLAPRQS